ncbi:MAG: hypothetical protein ACK55I_48465, partial [bacterium]
MDDTAPTFPVEEESTDDTIVHVNEEVLKAVSDGVQIFLKNILDSACKAANHRTNKNTCNAFDILSKMINEEGKGNAIPENQMNIALAWGDDIQA